MSSIMGFSRCRIQFIPNDRQSTARNYSDRSLIELRELDFPNFKLQALDIDNKKEKIFDIRLKKENQYKRGRSNDSPDEICSNDGTYRLWLNEESRDGFYKELDRCFQQMSLIDQPNSDSDESYQDDDDSEDDTTNSGFTDRDYYVPPTQPNPSAVSSKDLLLDVHNLGKYIKQGDATTAARIASQLASKGVHLQAKSSRNTENEKEFTVHVQLDGNEYGVDQHGGKIPVDVFQSTTIRELRAAFELAYQYPPTNQYFFVNGVLAHDSLTMKELKVGPNSLFVLFLLTHAKSFKRNGPWQCSTCKTDNQQHILRCGTCSAPRRD